MKDESNVIYFSINLRQQSQEWTPREYFFKEIEIFIKLR